MQSKNHWEHVYATKPTDKVSWYQEHAAQSVRLIQATGVPLDTSIVDVGGGASTLVDDLLDRGYSDLTVLDLSAFALQAARQRLGARSARVRWIEANITTVQLPRHHFDVWHDRAVFHFLTLPQDRHAYVAAVLGAVKPGGHVIVATFAEEGPMQCSGLPVIATARASFMPSSGNRSRCCGMNARNTSPPEGQCRSSSTATVE